MRVAAVIATLVLSLQMTAGVTLAVYVSSCATGSLDTNWSIVDRSKSNPNITGVIGQATIRTLRPCLTPNGVNWDIPWVLPANLQANTTDPNKIVQIGYARCGRPVADGDCNTNIPNDGKMHFVYTAADNSGGLLKLADGWYKAPVAGHEYRFKIVNGADVWTYCIQDRTAGEGYDCHNTADTWTSGTYSWYGTETNNDNSQNGNSFNESELNIRWMQYQRSGTWYVVTDQVGCDSISTGVYPSYYHCLITSTVDADGDGQVNDNETLWSHTHDH